MTNLEGMGLVHDFADVPSTYVLDIWNAEYDAHYENEERNVRATKIRALRVIADFYESHPDVYIPWGATRVSEHAYDKEELQKWAKRIPGNKKKHYDEDYLYVEGFLDAEETVPIKITCGRKAVCERVVTGTELKEVDVYPESHKELKEVEIVEWKCDPIMLPDFTPSPE